MSWASLPVNTIFHYAEGLSAIVMTEKQPSSLGMLAAEGILQFALPGSGIFQALHWKVALGSEAWPSPARLKP